MLCKYFSVCFQINYNRTKKKFSKNGQIYMKDAQCPETNEKSIIRFLRFLVYEIWQFKIRRVVWNFFFLLKDAQCSQTDFTLNLTIFRILAFEIWSILYSTFVSNWGLLTRIRKKKVCQKDSTPQNSQASGGLSLPPGSLPKYQIHYEC